MRPSRRFWSVPPLLLGAVLAVGPGAGEARGAAEFRADRDFLANVLGKLPPTRFEKAGVYRGAVDAFRLVAIDPEARRVVVACRVAGVFDESEAVATLSKRPAPARPGGPAGPPTWRAFRFDLTVGVNVEPGPDGGPRFRFEVESVRRRELEGVAGGLAKVMGRAFDGVVTAYADRKAAEFDDRLNAEVVRKVALLRDYGRLTGVDYAPTGVVLRFDQTRLRSEGVVGHVFDAPRPGTVPLYRWANDRLGAHAYTTDPGGPNPKRFRPEGIACHVYPGPVAGSRPMYRYRGKVECLYAMTVNKALMARAGYRFEGPAFHDDTTRPDDAPPDGREPAGGGDGRPG